MKHCLALAALSAMTLAACQQDDPNNFAIDEGNSLNAEFETLPPDESSAGSADGNRGGNSVMPEPPAGTAATIPAQYHGRWGMVAADCTSTAGDNKGLISIDDRKVRFYEAVATLEERRPAIATSFSGRFTVTGEGQTWEKVMTFTRTGDSLKRAEEAGSFTYQRCA